MMFTVLISIFLPVAVSSNVIVTEKAEYEDKVVLRVVNGKPAKAGQFTYQVSLKKHFQELEPNEYMNVCGGGLIGPSLVLTAAHCFEKDGNSCQQCCRKAQFVNPKKYYVVAGSLENFQLFEGDGQWRSIKKFNPHGGYWFPDKDLAIVHTNKPFELNDKVTVIPFARQSQDYGGVKCEFAGFGRTRYSSDEYAINLMWANLTLVPKSECSRMHRQKMDAFICTRIIKENVLEGDSGGPLVCKNIGDPNDKGQGVIVGIESGAMGVVVLKNFFTRVSHYSDFIAKGESCETPYPEFYIILSSIIVSSVYR